MSFHAETAYDQADREHHDDGLDYRPTDAELFLDQADPDEAAEFYRDRAETAHVANLKRRHRARDPWEGLG